MIRRNQAHYQTFTLGAEALEFFSAPTAIDNDGNHVIKPLETTKKTTVRGSIYVSYSIFSFVLTVVANQDLLPRGDVQRHGVKRIHSAGT